MHLLKSKICTFEIKNEVFRQTGVSGNYRHTMMQFLTALISLTVLFSYGQTNDTIRIKHKQEKYYLTKTCYDILDWDEVILKDKAVENKINSAIRTAVSSYKLDSNRSDVEARCNKQMDYEPECKIVYAKHNLITYILTAYTYYKDTPHGYREFQTINFNSKTGERINFHDFIDSSKIEAIDTVIIHKLKERLQISDDIYLDHYKNQLPNLYFELRENGIDIDFIGENYATSVIGVYLDFKELEPFVDKKGLLKVFYTTTK